VYYILYTIYCKKAIYRDSLDFYLRRCSFINEKRIKLNLLVESLKLSWVPEKLSNAEDLTIVRRWVTLFKSRSLVLRLQKLSII